VRTRLTALADLSDRDIDAWRELAARALEPNPFVGPTSPWRPRAAWEAVARRC
jgi:hypothetical protein